MSGRKKSRTRLTWRRTLRRNKQRRFELERQQRVRREAMIERRIGIVRKRARQERNCTILGRDARVVRAFYVNDVLMFETTMMHVQIEDKKYRIGKFEVQLDPTLAKPLTLCLESGRRDGREPKYYMTWGGDPWFCVGDRMDLLRYLVRSGEDLAAAYLMLEAFEHVNPEHHEEVAGTSIPVPIR
ncbi:MAG TPA: hypothetical protein VEA36_01220 [Candidatus Paceibacterota bacterium]|nr:hypothetical protein [Candidatus Paceibacterota bacterium]